MKILLEACGVPVFKGAYNYGTFKERAVAGNLHLDRQGQRKFSSHQQNYFIPHTMETWNWRVSFNLEFLPCNYANRDISDQVILALVDTHVMVS